MAHTYTSLLTHVVFSTHQRRATLTAEIRRRVHEYLGGVAKALRARPLIINGIDDHAHMLLELPPTLAIADAIQKIKGNASRWISEEFSRLFDWQRGYGAFTVSRRNVDGVIRYIANQEEHHRTRSYEDELRELLEEHGVRFDRRYLV